MRLESIIKWRPAVCLGEVGYSIEDGFTAMKVFTSFMEGIGSSTMSAAEK
jgi:hypothetical protein